RLLPNSPAIRIRRERGNFRSGRPREGWAQGAAADSTRRSLRGETASMLPLGPESGTHGFLLLFRPEPREVPDIQGAMALPLPVRSRILAIETSDMALMAENAAVGKPAANPEWLSRRIDLSASPERTGAAHLVASGASARTEPAGAARHAEGL